MRRSARTAFITNKGFKRCLVSGASEPGIHLRTSSPIQCYPAEENLHGRRALTTDGRLADYPVAVPMMDMHNRRGWRLDCLPGSRASASCSAKVCWRSTRASVLWTGRHPTDGYRCERDTRPQRQLSRSFLSTIDDIVSQHLEDQIAALVRIGGRELRAENRYRQLYLRQTGFVSGRDSWGNLRLTKNIEA